MTVWLTRIVPDLRSKTARRDLGNAQSMHRQLMSFFPDHAGPDPRARYNVLHRTETTPTGVHILLQSTHQPDLTGLPDGYGTHQSRPLDTLLAALQKGRTVNYRCTASAVRKPGATTRALYNLPAVVPLSGTHADQWWLRQAENAGLTPLTLHSQPLDAATALRGQRGSGTEQRVRHARTQFDGTATITDPDKLRTALTTGIGRGKAYGCGLLSLAPARTTPA